MLSGSGSGVELPDGNRKVASSNPGSPRVSVEVSLGKTLNPKLLPMYRLVPCMVSPGIGV